jgi:hypothetical protein
MKPRTGLGLGPRRLRIGRQRGPGSRLFQSSRTKGPAGNPATGGNRWRAISFGSFWGIAFRRKGPIPRNNRPAEGTPGTLRRSSSGSQDAMQDNPTNEDLRLRALGRMLGRLGPEPLTRLAMLRLWQAYARSLDHPTAKQRTLFLDLLRKVERFRAPAISKKTTPQPVLSSARRHRRTPATSAPC